MFGTLGRPWRAHRELDGLSDVECRELIERRWRREPPRLWVVQWGTGAAVLVSGPAVVAYFETQTQFTDDPRADPVVVYALIMGVAAVVAGCAGLLVHWGLEHWIVCRTLARIVRGACCPRCDQSLIGLPIYDDAHRPEDQSRKRVRCPECGKVVRLLKYGYSPQDFASWDQRVLPKDFEVRLKDGQWE
jgi:hypothetical protein